MKRKQFLKVAGTLGVGTLVPLSKFNVLNAESIGEPPVACTLIPSETRGPFPLFDASNVGSQSALVRSDIVGDYLSASGQTNAGVPLTLTITVQNLDCTPLPNMKVYIWHCSKQGRYSGYSVSNNPGQAGYTYFRGIQTTDSNGQVTFSTIYPGWYSGRLTHIHCEVYNGNVLKRTSQIAFPLDSVSGSPTALVNAAYGNSNNTITSYNGDNVFSDGYTSQLMSSLTGSVAAGYTGAFTLTIDQVAVPVELLSFKGGLEKKQAKLWWTTASEVNFSHFELERSAHPSKNYEKIAQIKGQNQGYNTEYAYVDGQILFDDIVYYRLKMVDLDGTVEYSKVVAINLSEMGKMTLAPNPVSRELILNHPPAYANTIVKFATLDGRLVAHTLIQENATASSFDVGWLARGTYFLIVESGIDRYTFQFVKL